MGKVVVGLGRLDAGDVRHAISVLIGAAIACIILLFRFRYMVRRIYPDQDQGLVVWSQ